jgi:CheY-like chemotaxis protein
MPKILVVEDSNVMQVYYTQILSRMPSCQFSFVKNGQEALDHIGRKGPPDIVVLDINMPVMDGLEFLGHFRGGARHHPPRSSLSAQRGGRTTSSAGWRRARALTCASRFDPKRSRS